MSADTPLSSEAAPTPGDPRRLAAARAAWDWREPAPPAAGNERRKMVLQALIGLGAALIFWRLHAHRASTVAAIAAILSAGLALLAPRGVLRALQHAIEAFGRGVGAVVSAVVLTLVYFAFIVPVGLFVRRRAGALYKKGIDRTAPTYWTRPTGSPSSEHPF